MLPEGTAERERGELREGASRGAAIQPVIRGLRADYLPSRRPVDLTGQALRYPFQPGQAFAQQAGSRELAHRTPSGKALNRLKLNGALSLPPGTVTRPGCG